MPRSFISNLVSIQDSEDLKISYKKYPVILHASKKCHEISYHEIKMFLGN